LQWNSAQYLNYDVFAGTSPGLLTDRVASNFPSRRSGNLLDQPTVGRFAVLSAPGYPLSRSTLQYVEPGLRLGTAEIITDRDLVAAGGEKGDRTAAFARES